MPAPTSSRSSTPTAATRCGAGPHAASSREGDGVLFRFLNASKRSVTSPGTTAPAALAFASSWRGADVVVESDGPAPSTGTSSAERARARRWCRSRGSDAAGHGATGRRPSSPCRRGAGATAIRGTVERPPIAAGGRLGEWLGGGYAAIGAPRRDGRRAPHRPRPARRRVAARGRAPLHGAVRDASSRASAAPSVAGRTVEIPSIEPAADGYVGFCTITNQQWRDFLVLIERGDLVDDAELAHYFTRNAAPARSVRDDPRVDAPAHGSRDRRARDAAPHPGRPIGNGETVTGLEQFRARGVYVPGADRRRAAASAVSARTRAAASTRRPHRASASTPGSSGAARPQPRRPATAPPCPSRASACFDFTMFWAGPFVGHFLATLGADVIKVESIQRPDGIRFASTQQPTAERWWEWCAMLHGMNAGKRGITLDLSRPRGVELARALVARADVRGRELLAARARQPRAPLRRPRARESGPRHGAHAGLRPRRPVARSHRLRADDGAGLRHGLGHRLRRRAAAHPARAVRSAGRHACRAGAAGRARASPRDRRGTAGRVDDGRGGAQCHRRPGARAAGLRPARPRATAIAAPSPRRRTSTRAAARSSGSRIAVATDAQWAALVARARIAGMGDGPFRSRPARAGAPATIGSTRRWPRTVATRIATRSSSGCLAAGVPAAPVVHPSDLAQNPQIRARGFLEAVAHPVTGAHELPGLPMRFSDMERFIARPPRRSASTRPPCSARCSASTTRRSRRCAPSA